VPSPYIRCANFYLVRSITVKGPTIGPVSLSVFAGHQAAYYETWLKKYNWSLRRWEDVSGAYYISAEDLSNYGNPTYPSFTWTVYQPGDYTVVSRVRWFDALGKRLLGYKDVFPDRASDFEILGGAAAAAGSCRFTS
jgi:hypothetical protein